MSSTTLDLSAEFAGRRALVTGGSRGIGAAIAARLLAGGAKVVVTARTPTGATPPAATFIASDLRTQPGAQALAAEALTVLGGLDILVNNAGAARPYLPGSAAIPDQEWQDSLDINFLSAVRLVNATLPALRDSGSAAIVNVSSGGATPLPAPLLHYGAAKTALNAYTLGLAAELAPAGIRVNIVTPGPVRSPGGDEIRQALADATGAPPEAMTGMVPLSRFGEPEEVAEMVALLVSDRGRWITMHNYFVDGGLGAK
jgi:NAD(P)-dependent dehydrogenase (short-subunit alcohol dehydrogenase family)